VFDVIATITDNVKLVVWLSEPEVPVRVTVAFPVAADELAEKTSVCDCPGVRVRVEGEVVTPWGRPLACTVISAEKPLVPLAEIDTDDDSPC
jgi:hypothetical protein